MLIKRVSDCASGGGECRIFESRPVQCHFGSAVLNTGGKAPFRVRHRIRATNGSNLLWLQPPAALRARFQNGTLFALLARLVKTQSQSALMSIYDDLGPETPIEPTQEVSAVSPVPAEAVEPPTQSQESESPKKRAGCGCSSCFGGCAMASLVVAILFVVGGLLVWKMLPGWTHDALVAAVEDSELSDEDKQSVVAQLDRVYDEYESGRLSMHQLGRLAEHIGESPLFTRALAYAAMENYIQPSGLSDEEKQNAERTLQRVARGVFEEQIEQRRLDPALDYISTEDSQGQRQFNESVSDEDLREMLAACRRLADNAGVPDAPFDVDIGGELKRAVDETLADTVDGAM